MRFLSSPAVPVVTALPSAGKAGRILSLLSDGHLYHDNGASWDDLSVSATFNVPWVRAGSNAYHCAGDGVNPALISQAITASLIYYMPFSVPKIVTLTQMGFGVTTAAAGTARVGIYANDGSGSTDVPGSLLAEGASTLDTGSTGTKLTNIDITLQPGVIYWAAAAFSAAPTVYSVNQTGLFSAVGRGVDTATIYKGFTESGSGSTLPAAAGTITYSTLGQPALYLVP